VENAKKKRDRLAAKEAMAATKENKTQPKINKYFVKKTIICILNKI